MKKTKNPAKADKEYKPDLSFLPVWAKKMKKTVDELEKEIKSVVAELTKKHGNAWSDEKKYATARRRVYSENKSNIKSNAVEFDFCPLYGGEPKDFGAMRYKANMDMFNTNPLKAKKEGYVRVEKDAKTGKTNVIPLDEKPKTKAGKQNMRFGKPLPQHDWILTIGGIAAPSNKIDNEEYEYIRPSELILSGQYANKDNKNSYIGSGFEFGKWYRIKVTNKTAETVEDKWVLNATSLTKWNDKLAIETSMDEIKNYFADFYCPLGELEEYHDNYAKEGSDGNKTFSNQIVLTEGEVIDIVLSEDGIKSHRIVIDDESLGLGAEDSDEIPESITCWVDANTKIDFGKYSRVIIFGTTSKSKRKDMATNEYTDKWNAPTISAKSIIVIDRVDPEIENEEAAGDENDDKLVTGDVVEVEEPDVEIITEVDIDNGKTDEIDDVEIIENDTNKIVKGDKLEKKTTSKKKW